MTENLKTEYLTLDEIGEPYCEDFVTEASPKSRDNLRASLEENGVLNPIVTTQDFKVVDGNKRVASIKYLREQERWTHGDTIPVIVIPDDQVDAHIDADRLSPDGYSKLQRAMFGARWHWDDMQEEIIPGEHKTTQGLVAKYMDTNREYVQKCHNLLNLADDLFYNVIYVNNCRFVCDDKEYKCVTYDEILAFLTMHDSEEEREQGMTKDILSRMKEIVIDRNQKMVDRFLEAYEKAYKENKRNKLTVYHYVYNLAASDWRKDNGLTGNHSHDYPDQCGSVEFGHVDVPDELRNEYRRIVDSFKKALQKIGIILYPGEDLI